MKKLYELLKNNLSQFKNIFLYGYSNVYPEIYCSTNRKGFYLKSIFHIVFKAYKDKKNEHLGKKTQNYKTKHKEAKSLNKSPKKLLILTKLKKKKSKSELKKEK